MGLLKSSDSQPGRQPESQPDANSAKLYATDESINQQTTEHVSKNGLEDIENISDDEAETLLLQELSKLDQT